MGIRFLLRTCYAYPRGVNVLDHAANDSFSDTSSAALGYAWRDLPAVQQPNWPDADELAAAVAELSTLPPLIFAGEADMLKARLAEAAQGKAFLLQGGDCAETFADATADRIKGRVKTILQMAVVLTYGARVPVVKVGRMAGQFAKPRSSDTETRGNITLPAFRGDAVNSFDFTEESRRPDPQRLIQAYHTSASTLNLIRAFTRGGFADLRRVQAWNNGFVANESYSRYETMAGEIGRALEFMEACGVELDALRDVEFYSSHEALLLDYEESLTRIDSRTEHPYVVSGHMVWIGERTRQLDHAHVDFLSRVRNPIGVKLGPTSTVSDALALADKLDPQREPGRLTFITRMGATTIREKLPALIKGVTDAGITPLWVCDPMHGNTFTSDSGFKTRSFDDVVDEVQGFFEVHNELGTWPGGVHIELTGDDVTECLGGGAAIDDAGLAHRYESVCDPRLNHEQSLELAFLVSQMLKDR